MVQQWLIIYLYTKLEGLGSWDDDG
jgi:hypothetical protein